MSYNPLNFLSEIARDFVATKYLKQSAASSPPTPTSSASTFSTSSGRSDHAANSASSPPPRTPLMNEQARTHPVRRMTEPMQNLPLTVHTVHPPYAFGTTS